MNKLCFFFVIFFIFIFSLSFTSSKFVCGFVNNSKEYSSSWSKVIVYPVGEPLNYTECKVNPENKFCCDLDEIKGFTSSIGKNVFAEVFDREGGFVAGPVSLYLTEEGYDIFPSMNLQKAVIINSPSERIFINQSSILINVSLVSNYNNLKYSLNSSNGYSEQQVCNNCDGLTFPISLSKGKNEINIIAYKGSKNISEKITFYNLDYLNFNMNIVCDKCKLKGDTFQVPSGKDIKFYSSFNASHNISGDFLFYFPSEWNLSYSLNREDFSLTHKIIDENILNKKESSFNYTIKSPNTFIKEEYLFYQKIGDKESLTKVMVSKLTLMPFHRSKPFGNTYFTEIITQRGSPEEPIILNSKDNYIKLVAIFPKKEILKSYSTLNINEEGRGKNKKYFFTILTTIPQRDIEKILLIFKSEKGKSLEVYGAKDKINLELYEEDSNYTYYSATVNEKGPFNVRII